jgi:hypothetical protein
MIDRYKSLSIDSTLELLNQWRLASTKLRLMADASSGVKFTGIVRVVKAETAFEVLLACGEEGEIEWSFANAELLRVSEDEPHLWLACKKPGLRFVLEVEDDEPLDVSKIEDFPLVTTEPQ